MKRKNPNITRLRRLLMECEFAMFCLLTFREPQDRDRAERARASIRKDVDLWLRQPKRKARRSKK